MATTSTAPAIRMICISRLFFSYFFWASARLPLIRSARSFCSSALVVAPAFCVVLDDAFWDVDPELCGCLLAPDFFCWLDINAPRQRYSSPLRRFPLSDDIPSGG